MLFGGMLWILAREMWPTQLQFSETHLAEGFCLISDLEKKSQLIFRECHPLLLLFLDWRCHRQLSVWAR